MRERADFGIGYPKITPIYRCMKEGAGASQKGRPPGVSIPSDVEQTEQAVCAMPFRLRTAVRWKYLRRLRDKDSAARAGISLSMFRLRIEQAHYWILGRMSDAA